MEGNVDTGGGRRGSRLKIAAGATAALMLLPLFAMQVTDQVDWGLADFAIFGALLVGAGATYELAARMTGNTAYRSAVGVALAAALLLVWVNGAVGIIGDEDNVANVMYYGVLAVGVIGAIIAGIQPRGMARALFATGLVQALIAVITLVAGLGGPANPAREILILNGFFVALFVGSALLFRRAARGEDSDMALINCPECSSRISDAAAVCPNCGIGIALAGEAQAAEATLATIQDTSNKLKMHRLLSTLIVVIGFVLMIGKMYADSEPGGIPILLVVFGIGWYFITRIRTRSHRT